MEGPLELERRGWEALSVGGETARGFYEDVLAGEVTMLLPFGLYLDDREVALRSMSGDPWDAYELRDERVLELGEDVAVVTYLVAAERGGQPYEALVASTYVRDRGTWRLRIHQQTPTG